MTEHIDQKHYRLEWIACKNLSVVWLQSQRKYREAEAKKIAQNFDPDLLDPLKVTLPNGEGKYHICDGQTRKAAIEMLWGQDEMVPCLVADEGDPVKAAKIFLSTNTSRRSPSIIDNFKVSVTAQMPIEVAIDKIVRRHGYRVDAPANGAISAVAALKFAYGCGKIVLDQTLSIIKDTWGEDRNATNGNIIRGIAAFMNEFGDKVDRDRFCEVVRKKWTPGSLLQETKTMRELYGVASPVEAIKQMLLNAYNHRATKKIRPKSLVDA